jgi:excisionase family DNA binding protein
MTNKLDTTKRDKLWKILSDPIISLQDAAQIIGVCKESVRRYTRAGTLTCLRTPGNQRRFLLSDVMRFIEERGDKPCQI